MVIVLPFEHPPTSCGFRNEPRTPGPSIRGRTLLAQTGLLLTATGTFPENKIHFLDLSFRLLHLSDAFFLLDGFYLNYHCSLLPLTKHPLIIVGGYDHFLGICGIHIYMFHICMHSFPLFLNNKFFLIQTQIRKS